MTNRAPAWATMDIANATPDVLDSLIEAAQADGHHVPPGRFFTSLAKCTYLRACRERRWQALRDDKKAEEERPPQTFTGLTASEANEYIATWLPWAK